MSRKLLNKHFACDGFRERETSKNHSISRRLFSCNTNTWSWQQLNLCWWLIIGKCQEESPP
jgi:hypothetical protein